MIRSISPSEGIRMHDDHTEMAFFSFRHRITIVEKSWSNSSILSTEKIALLQNYIDLQFGCDLFDKAH